MKHDYCAEHGDVLLRPLHRYDIEYLRQWRNRRELNQFLRNIGEITEEQQEQWFEDYIQNKDLIFFVIDYKRRKTVGSVALYGFDRQTCQIGKLIIGENEVRGQGLGRETFLMAITIAVEELKIKEFKLSVHENNIAAKKIYDRIGFEKVGYHQFYSGGIEFEMSASAARIAILNKEVERIRLYKEDVDDRT